MSEYQGKDTGSTYNLLIQRLSELRESVHEIRKDMGVIKDRLACLPFDVHEERIIVITERVKKLEDWRAGLWKSLALFIGAASAAAQAVMRVFWRD